MLSKAHVHMSNQLKKISVKFGVRLLSEVREGDKKYDFYFPTTPPIVVEVDGQQHTQVKADGFFFKTDTALMKYKKNDAEREMLNRVGKIKLYRYTSEEFPSMMELLDVLDIEILKKGEDLKNAHTKYIRFNEEVKARRKEQNSKFKQKLKEQSGDGNRPVKKFAGNSDNKFEF